MATIMVFGYAFAKTPIMERGLTALCNCIHPPWPPISLRPRQQPCFPGCAGPPA
jgi:hypothetical protein